MSQTETHFGKLRRVASGFDENNTLEEWCIREFRKQGVTELKSYYDSWVEQFKDRFSEKYFIVNGEVWEAFEHVKNDGFDDINVMIPNEDGTVTFIQQFYNGGTCLDEVIEEELGRWLSEKKTNDLVD